MRKKAIMLLALVLLFMAGSSSAVTVITNQAELQAIANDVAGDYVLGNDIVLTGTFTSIMEFTGTFDGAFHIIDGLTRTVVGTRACGIFGRTVAGSVVKNVGMTNVNITSDGESPNYIGVLISDSKGIVDKCFLEGGSITITGATGGNNSGSLIGLNRETGSITNCYVSGVTISNNSNMMNGIGGFANSNGGGLIENCYVNVTADLTGRDVAATSGFARDLGGGGVISCYYNMDITTIAGTSPFDDGSGMGRTTKEMLTQATYVGWDFDNTWTMIEGLKYPVLMEFPYYRFRGLKKISPADGVQAVPGDVELSWENIILDLDNPGDVYVEVLFGTEPNAANPAYDIAAVTLDPVSGLNVTSVTKEGLGNGTYYWQVNSYLYGDPAIVDYNTGDPNVVKGPLWTFDVVGDPAPVIESITGDQMTWSGESVPLVATITNGDESPTTIEWVADPADNVTITGGDTATPTVTITKMPYSVAKIVNASFEHPVIADGINDGTTPTGWTKIGSSGMANPAPGTIIDTASEGEQCLWANVGGAFSIVLSETVQAGATYTLNADIGHGLWSNSNSKYLVQLIAVDGENELVLAEDYNSLTIASQAWVTSEVLYTNDPVADANKIDLPLMVKLINPDDGSSDVEFDNVVLTTDTPFPISTGVETVTLTVSVSDGGNPIPVTASVEIDVYDDACHMARLAFGADDLNDFDKDCDIDIEDLALQAATWLNDIALDGPVASPDQGDSSLVINGGFQVYKAGTDLTVKAKWEPGNVFTGGIEGDVAVSGGNAICEDGTLTTVINCPGWINSAPGVGLFNRGVANSLDTGTTTVESFGAWGGGGNGTRIVSAEPLGIINNGTVYTLKAQVRGAVSAGPITLDMLADGVAVVPSSSVEPTGSDVFEDVIRTYNPEDLSAYVGQSITVEVGSAAGNAIVGRASWDNVALETEVVDANLPSVDAGENMITWNDQAVTLNPTVSNNDPQVPQRELSYLWTAYPADGVTIIGADTETPTVTITKPAGDTARVKLTLAVTLDGVGLVGDSMVINVYDDVCLTSLASNSELDLDLGDINEDCNTDLEDFAGIAAAWLVDYSSTGPLDQPEE
ncbi:MAG: hypothetical protein K9M75_13020 [Phycisphaerae bacterium]|nr:hypothetical protein [Phycisphaerae bacterium]